MRKSTIILPLLIVVLFSCKKENEDTSAKLPDPPGETNSLILQDSTIVLQASDPDDWENDSTIMWPVDLDLDGTDDFEVVIEEGRKICSWEPREMPYQRIDFRSLHLHHYFLLGLPLASGDSIGYFTTETDSTSWRNDFHIAENEPCDERVGFLPNEKFVVALRLDKQDGPHYGYLIFRIENMEWALRKRAKFFLHKTVLEQEPGKTITIDF